LATETSTLTDTTQATESSTLRETALQDVLLFEHLPLLLSNYSSVNVTFALNYTHGAVFNINENIITETNINETSKSLELLKEANVMLKADDQLLSECLHLADYTENLLQITQDKEQSEKSEIANNGIAMSSPFYITYIMLSVLTLLFVICAFVVILVRPSLLFRFKKPSLLFRFKESNVDPEATDTYLAPETRSAAELSKHEEQRSSLPQGRISQREQGN
jgi:hypothetical protein